MTDRDRSVLVVDDEDVVLQVAQRMLERLGYQPLVAMSGTRAIELFQDRQEDIACVIVDASMGGLSGIETVRELRLIRPEIPIIISSGLGRDEVADRLGEIEAPAAFLRKPYRLANLSGVLAQVLSNGGPH